MTNPYTHTARNETSELRTARTVEQWEDQQLHPRHLERAQDRYERHLEEKARG